MAHAHIKALADARLAAYDAADAAYDAAARLLALRDAARALAPAATAAYTRALSECRDTTNAAVEADACLRAALRMEGR